jgi:hypothetical protein
MAILAKWCAFDSQLYAMLHFSPNSNKSTNHKNNLGGFKKMLNFFLKNKFLKRIFFVVKVKEEFFCNIQAYYNFLKWKISSLINM